MGVRAKMKCTEKTGTAEAGGSIKLEAVYDGGDENSSWSKYTPSGSVTMWVTNPAAYDGFEVGQKYYIDFTPVPVPAEA